MNRDDKSKYLLYIEPPASEKLKSPIEDDITKLIEMALSKAIPGVSRYNDINDMGDGYDWEYKGVIKRVPSFHKDMSFKGLHRTSCGQLSSSTDYLLENGMITNSLATYYVKWYRYSIPENDIIKIEELKNFYNKLGKLN